MTTILLISFAAFFTSSLTAAMGVGGGVVLLALLAQIVPPGVLIPLHGAAQLMSNTSRVIVQRQHIHWGYIQSFSIGALLGGLLLTPLILYVPPHVGQLALGLFIVVSVWRSPWLRLQTWSAWLSGAVTSGLSLVLGATGPLVMSVLPRDQWEKKAIVGTHGMAMTVQHGVKLIAFSSLSFSITEYWPMLVGIGMATILGNLFGARLLEKVNERLFKKGLDWLLTLLALRLIWQGTSGFLTGS